MRGREERAGEEGDKEKRTMKTRMLRRAGC